MSCSLCSLPVCGPDGAEDKAEPGTISDPVSANRDAAGWFGEALTNDRFETWFQPIVDTNLHRVVAHECLIRLNSGCICNGSEIVDAARARGQIHAFDSHARRLAIRSAAGQTTDSSGLYFINFMPAAICSPEHCLTSTFAALTDSGKDPAGIVLEAVESDSAQDTPHLFGIRDYCRRAGVGFALDNLGTALSCPQLIRDLRPDFIKLDRTLASHIEQPKYASTVRKLVEVASQVGAIVIAEGIEKPETMENFWLLGVQWMQGYFFGHPAPRIARQTFAPASGAREDLHMTDPDLINLSHALAAECRIETPIRKS